MSGVALAMRYRLQWFIHLRAHGHGKGDEHPTYAPNWNMVHFILLFTYTYERLKLVYSVCVKVKVKVRVLLFVVV